MKKPIRFALALTLGASFAAANAADWYAAQDPFVLYGHTYYVGTGGISSVLITSPAGHILIDGGPPGAGTQIAEHIRRLGFKLKDVRYILSSHEHQDHAGAIAELQKLSGAAVLGTPASVQVLRSGRPDKGDPQYPDLTPMTPVAKTRAVHDGEVVTLGPLAVTAHFTPGHSKGANSWTWRESEGGRTVNMVYADSLTTVVAKGRRYSGNPGWPSALQDIGRSLDMVAALDCDVLITPHPEASGLWERKARQPQLGNAAFIDREACRNYAAGGRAALAKTLAAEGASRPRD